MGLAPSTGPRSVARDNSERPPLAPAPAAAAADRHVAINMKNLFMTSLALVDVVRAIPAERHAHLSPDALMAGNVRSTPMASQQCGQESFVRDAFVWREYCTL